MKHVRNILSYSILCTILLSCTGREDVSDVMDGKGMDLVFSVGTMTESTRQSLDVIQAAGQPFRGLQTLTILPFRTNGAVSSENSPLLLPATGTETANRVAGQYYYYVGDCAMMKGTNRILAYAQAAPVEGKESPLQNGKVETTLAKRMSPADITFSLSPICESTDANQAALDLAAYLTAIANTPGWSTTDDGAMKALYVDFIHTDAEETGLMAGSAANVKAYVAELETKLDDSELSAAIRAKINDSALNACLSNGYPSAATSLGLPDGAAALRWTGNEFSVRTTKTTLDNINGINRYTYPAELWYYVDSPIRTSNIRLDKTFYQDKNNWNSILNTFFGGKSITASTKAVAVEQPLQYGVGRMQLTLETITGTLKDSKDQVVENTSAANLPLTAVITGGQHTVGFDFKPMEPESDVDARFIYDPIVGTSGTVNTLVLQTYDGEKVPVVLEFENKTGNKFHGKDGIIYPNTKFYLIGLVDPADGDGDDELKARVFTQDHTTKMTMKVTSLANAYSCMPDLLSPRLELGVQVVTQWIYSTPTTVIL